MKKIIFLLISTLAIAFGVQGQTGYDTRLKTGTGKDNTFRNATFFEDTVTAKASIALVPGDAYENLIRIDSLDATGVWAAAHTITTSVTKAHHGDKMTIMFGTTNLDASRVVTFSTGFKSSGTLTIADGKQATITFIYDTVTDKYLEVARATGL